jgi:ankyrin repeat protein
VNEIPAKLNDRTALQAAAEHGHLSTIQLLLREGASLELRTRWGFTALHLAVKNGHKAAARHLLEAGADITPRTDDRLTVLHSAAQNGLTDIVALLLQSAHCNMPNRTPRSRRFQSARESTLLDARTWRGCNALCLAAGNGHFPVVKLLLEAGEDHKVHGCDCSPLGRAVSRGDEATAVLLLENKADPNIRDWISGTPLEVAVSKGNKKLVELLLKKGADPDAVKLERSFRYSLASQDIVNIIKDAQQRKKPSE